MSTAASMSATSPGSVVSSNESSYGGGLSPKEIELQRKRARDRKSQQAMRDRTKWTINNLTEQVAFLTQALEDRTRDVGALDARLRSLETENAHLRTQNAALQLSLIGCSQNGISPPASSPRPWRIPPINSPASCIADQLLQGFLDSQRKRFGNPGEGPAQDSRASRKPNLLCLLYKDRRTDDDVSNVVGDIIRSYLEIDTLPKQVACFYIMSSLLKWIVFLDKASWDIMPVWLRPLSCQLTTPHASWVDRIPWPKAREYLISHPDITLDDFAATYSSSFSVGWPYEPSLVLIKNQSGPDSGDVTINPVYEEHIRQLKNWSVGEAFRKRFPDLAALIDEDSQRL